MLTGGEVHEDKARDTMRAREDSPVTGLDCVYEVRHGGAEAIAACHSVAHYSFWVSCREELSMQLPTKPILTLDVAKQIATAAEAEAIKNSWPVVVAIVDPAGQLVYFQKIDDTQLGSVDVGIAKARCAALYKRASKAIAEVVAAGKIGMMGLPGAVAVEGGLPLFVNGDIVGAIGVSGVMSNQDGVVAQAGVDALAAIVSS